MEHDELMSWLRLSLTPGVGNVAARALLRAFGLPDAIFAQSPTALSQVVSNAQAQALQRAPMTLNAAFERTQAWLQGQEPKGSVRRILTLGDPCYPRALLEIADPPLLLYLLGASDFELPQLERSMAVVGSRNPTAQGTENAHAFGRAFVQADICVVSGLALGIDAAAHMGALEGAKPGQLATVAVVGTGLDQVYPSRHRNLAQRIASQGLVLSEFPLGTPPLNQNFPKRNRLIAGLSCGTLVVEAALRSGSLITARLASEQGREVFAIPGSIHSPQSRGCHDLIRQGAKLVATVADVLEELRFHPAPLEPLPASVMTASEPALLSELGFDPVSLDALCARTGYSPALLQAQLLELELEGRIARLPGGLFQRTERA